MQFLTFAHVIVQTQQLPFPAQIEFYQQAHNLVTQESIIGFFQACYSLVTEKKPPHSVLRHFLAGIIDFIHQARPINIPEHQRLGASHPELVHS